MPSLLYLPGNSEGRHNRFNCLLITIGVPSVTRKGLNVRKSFAEQTPECLGKGCRADEQGWE